jgi:hypothetical protein
MAASYNKKRPFLLAGVFRLMVALPFALKIPEIALIISLIRKIFEHPASDHRLSL